MTQDRARYVRFDERKQVPLVAQGIARVSHQQSRTFIQEVSRGLISI